MLRLIVTALLSLSLFACAVHPTTDYIANKDFSQYTHFAFPPSLEGMPNSIDSTRIKNAVTMQLEQKGLIKTTIEKANLQIFFRVKSETELKPTAISSSFAYSRHRGTLRMNIPENYYKYQYGKIVLEFVDPGTQSIVWQSISQRELQETITTDKRNQFINSEITLMLNTYPPAVK
ncbi:MAG: DUF4136 domain-containing protein [Psychromonas sp.]